jgi:hypothetical protein
MEAHPVLVLGRALLYDFGNWGQLHPHHSPLKNLQINQEGGEFENLFRPKEEEVSSTAIARMRGVEPRTSAIMSTWTYNLTPMCTVHHIRFIYVA